jgi:hypothetical protein
MFKDTQIGVVLFLDTMANDSGAFEVFVEASILDD